MDEFGLREMGKKEGPGGMPEVFYIYRNFNENSTTDWIGFGQNGLGQAWVFRDTGVKQESEVFETGMIAKLSVNWRLACHLNPSLIRPPSSASRASMTTPVIVLPFSSAYL
jgi:hypothetical protein